MLCMYANADLLVQNYDLKDKSDGEFSGAEWFDVKPSLKENNALMNLPYIIDGEHVIAQTNACFLYLGRKFNMLGSSEKELIWCEQLLCEVMDLRNKMVQFAYGPLCNSETASSLLSNVKLILDKLELYLSTQVAGGHSGTFLVGEKASAPDFHLWEMLDQYVSMCTFYSLPSVYEGRPHLESFKNTFGCLADNKKYLESKLHLSMPFNNKSAKFGASLDLSAWTTGKDYDWGNLSGKY